MARTGIKLLEQAGLAALARRLSRRVAPLAARASTRTRALNHDFPPAFGLLVACCRASFDPSTAATVAATTAEQDGLLALARRHRVVGLVARGLRTRAGLEHDARVIAAQGMRALGEAHRLSTGFAKAGIAHLFLKGAALGKLAYGDPFIKTAADIDLLVLPRAIGDAAALLTALGYCPLDRRLAARDALEARHRASKESSWIGPADTLPVDLHTRVADNARLLPAIDACSPRQPVAVAGAITLPTLARDELFAYLCVHGASSAWFRLKWLCDLAALLHASPPDEIARLHAASQALGAGRAAAQALLLCRRLFDTPLPDALYRELEASATNRWLVRLAMAQLLDPIEPTARRWGTATIHLGQFGLLPGAGYALSELRGQLRAARAHRLRR